MDNKELIRMALEAREQAYVPYSKYMVGAALLTKESKVYKGCNIENAAYTPTNCAERTAFLRQLAKENEILRQLRWSAATRGAPVDYAYPCGVCRQVMMEFCNPKSFRIITAISEEEYLEKTLEEILPHGFGPENL